MTPFRFALRQIAHRRSYATLFFLTLFLAATIVAGLSILESSARAELGARARDLAAGDLVIRAENPGPALDLISAQWPGAETARSIEAASMTRSGEAGDVEQVILRAVTPGYPLYGSIRLEDGRELEEALDSGKVVIEGRLADALGLEPGDTIQVGVLFPEVAGIIAERTDVSISLFNAAPLVFATIADLERSRLVVEGSRTRAAIYVRLPPDADVLSAKAAVERALGDPRAVTSWRDDRPGVGRALTRTFAFLDLLSFLTLVLAGASLAVIFNGLLKEEYTSFGIVKALGQPFEWTVRAWLWWGAILAFAGCASALGSGLLVSRSLAAIGAEAVGWKYGVSFDPTSAFGSVLIVLGLPIVVSVPFFRRLAVLEPAAVLSAEPRWAILRVRERAAFLALGSGYFFFCAWIGSGSALFSAWASLGVLGALTVVAGSVAAFGWAADRALRRFARRSIVRFALRPSGGRGYGWIAASGLALIFGLIATIAGLERNLSEEILAKNSPDLPNTYFINIRPAEAAHIADEVRVVSGEAPRLFPLVRGRIVAINGVPATRIQAERGDAGDRITREFGFTYGSDLLPTDAVAEGDELWDDRLAGPQVSVFDEFRDQFGMAVGDAVTVEVLGRRIDATVTSFREIDRSRREPFFYFQFRPGVLEEFPHTLMGAAVLDDRSLEQLRKRVLARMPHVTVFDLRSVTELVERLMTVFARVVNLLGSVSVAASFLLLVAVLYVSYIDMRREAVLYRVLGAPRSRLAAMYAARFGFLAIVTITAGSVPAFAVGYLVMTEVLEAGWKPHLPWGVAVFYGTAILLLAGIVVRRATHASPMEILRYE